MQIDVGAALRAERPKSLDGGLAADRAFVRAGGGIGHALHIGIARPMERPQPGPALCDRRLNGGSANQWFGQDADTLSGLCKRTVVPPAQVFATYEARLTLTMRSPDFPKEPSASAARDPALARAAPRDRIAP